MRRFIVCFLGLCFSACLQAGIPVWSSQPASSAAESPPAFDTSPTVVTHSTDTAENRCAFYRTVLSAPDAPLSSELRQAYQTEKQWVCHSER